MQKNSLAWRFELPHKFTIWEDTWARLHKRLVWIVRERSSMYNIISYCFKYLSEPPIYKLLKFFIFIFYVPYFLLLKFTFIIGWKLKKELRKGRVFDGWSEGTLHFPPTYKYANNSEKYIEDDHKGGRRSPAWYEACYDC